MGKMKKIAISILSFVFMATVGLLAIVLLDSNKNAHAETLTSVSYNETYKLGETVDIQAATFDYKGKTYEANTSIRFPNGDSYKYDKLVLTKAGKYSVNYSAIADDGSVLQETVSFTVLADTYSFDGKGTYAYGTNDYLPQDLQGINVSLARNSTFTINAPIDVSNLTKNDSILKFYATPEVKGAIEAGVVYVRLTDAHDASKFVEWQYRPISSFQYVYAYANDQYITGLKYTGSPTATSVEYDGYYFDLMHGEARNAGHLSRASFTGKMDPKNQEYLASTHFKNTEYTEQEMFFYNALECRMDYAQKRLYSQPDGQYAIKRCIIADFDDERTLGGKAPWDGFTTGEVFISIYAKDYTTSNFNFFITEVYGQDVSQLTMVNELAPRVTVDTKDYDRNNLPNAIVGKKYSLFNPVATDDTDGEVNVAVKVYNSIGASVPVTDGAFVPTKAGVYTIEYTAIDSFENKTVETLNVKAIDRSALDYELATAETQFKAGETVSIKELTLHNPSNVYALEIYANNAAQNVKYAIDGENLTFVPLYAGTYTVTYLYTDYCTREEITYDIVVTSSDLVVFDGDILLPRYIIKGLEYPVVPLYAYTFANSTQRELTAFYIKEGNATERLIEGDTYSVQSDATVVDFIYKAGGRSKTYTLPVVDAVSNNDGEYKINFAKYFYPTVGKFNAISAAQKIKFQVAESDNGVAKLDVINPARLINDFNIGFHFETGATNFTGIKVVLESAYDSEKDVSFTFERDIVDVAKVSVSSKNYVANSGISSQFRTPVNTSDNFNITYNSTTKEFDIGGFLVSTNELLKDFDDLFYISFEIYGINGDAAINITRVVNQQITDDEYDGTRPTVLYGAYKGYYVVGDEMVVNAVQTYDFVDPNPSCSLALQNTLGNMISVDGVALNGTQNDCYNAYVVNIEKVSRMNLKIPCEDFSGNSYNINLPLMVKDIIAPIIQLNVVNNLYEAGDTVTIADYVVEDETTAQGDLNVSYYLISPNGSIQYLSSESFEIEDAGEYVIYYIVRDEAGNNAYANYVIFVE